MDWKQASVIEDMEVTMCKIIVFRIEEQELTQSLAALNNCFRNFNVHLALREISSFCKALCIGK